MKTLIAYGTKYGFTKKCVDLLKNKLNGDIEIINLKDTKRINLDQFDTVVVGGSIYMGQIRKEVSDFCNDNLNSLQNKKLGLFVCGMREGEEAKEQINTVFPQELISKAIVTSAFGGEFVFKKMNFMEKMVVKKIVKISSDTENLMSNEIEKFANIMND